MKSRVNSTSLLVVVFLILTPIPVVSSLFQQKSEIQTVSKNNEILHSNEILKELEEEGINVAELSQRIETENPEISFGGFIQNLGQVSDNSIKMYLKVGGVSVGFSDSKVIFSSAIPNGDNLYFHITFLASNVVSPIGEVKKDHIINYIYSDVQFINVPTFDEIWYYGLYDGIDLRYHWCNDGLKYDFIVHPGADPSQIVIRVSDSMHVELENNHVLLNSNSHPEFAIFNDMGLKVSQNDVSIIGAKFELKVSNSNDYGFQIDTYDRSQVLIIDPKFWLSSWIGGGGDDFANDVAVDSNGNCYIVGTTDSVNFYTLNAFDNSISGVDAFVMKLNATYSIMFSTFIGGTNTEVGRSICVDRYGGIYITGYTISDNYPVTSNAYDKTRNETDVFVTKFNAQGGIAFSTFLGGTGTDEGNSIAVDQNLNCYVTGPTLSSDYPVKNAFDSTKNATDAFVTKLNTDGSDIIYSTFIGGTGGENAYSLAVDSDENAYITGPTTSSDFPLKNAYQGFHGGGVTDAFIVKLNSSGNGLLFSSYIGGDSPEDSYGIAVDNEGHTYICGSTESGNFPIVNSYDDTKDGTTDAFVVKINTLTSSLCFSTYLGGLSDDFANGITIDDEGYVYVAGTTWSNDFPLYMEMMGYIGMGMAFLTMFENNGSDIVFSTYLGAQLSNHGSALDVGLHGEMWVVGYSDAAVIVPINAFQPVHGGLYDGWIQMVQHEMNPPQILNMHHLPLNPADINDVNVSATIIDEEGGTGVGGARVYYRTLPPNGSWSSYTWVTMNHVGLDVYEATIAAQENGTFVEYYIWAYDASNYANNSDTPGNYTTGLPIVVEPDNILPTLDHPADIFYNEGDTGNSISWSPIDTNPSKYEILRDGVEVKSGIWNSTDINISISVDGLAVGQYNYTIVVFDIRENSESDAVIVTVEDNTAPSIEGPSDYEYEAGTIGHSLEWSCSDSTPNSYEVYMNDMLRFFRSWDGTDVSISIDGFDPGIYNYTLIIFDSNDHSSSDSVLVTVVDTTPPFVDSPPDAQITEGIEGVVIIWNPEDLYPFSHTILRDGKVVQLASWDGSSLSASLDGLEEGIYNYTIVIEDVSGNNAFDSVNVTVTAKPVTPITTTTTTTPTTTTITTTTTNDTGDLLGTVGIMAAVGGSGIAAVVIAFIVFKKRKGTK